MIKVFIDKMGPVSAAAVYIVDEDEQSGKRRVALPTKLMFTEIDEGNLVEPTLSFRSFQQAHQFLNALAQALIDAGYRDKTVSQSGEIKRMENHIHDLQRMAFNDK